MYELDNLLEPANTTSGLAERALIAPLSYFAEGGIKTVGVYAEAGDAVIITDTHQFLNGFGFIECQLAPDKNTYDAKSVGDLMFQKFENEVQIMLPGSYAVLHEFFKDLLNLPVILLVKDPNCAHNTWYQVGTECSPAYVLPNFETGTTVDGEKGYILTVSNLASCILLYKGSVTYVDEGSAPVARITATIAGDEILLDGSDSILNGVGVFKYEVFYNNDLNELQSIILPGTGDSTSFNLNTLIDWNGNGLAVVLTVTNEYSSDTTHTSDSSGNRPVILGSADEGFNEGFDFNFLN